MLVASSAGARALLQSSSSLWQLAFKRPLWLALLCCLAQQALKGLHWLGFLLCCSVPQTLKGWPSLESFSIGQLPALACEGEKLQWWFCPLHMTQQYRFASVATQHCSKGIRHHDLLPHVLLGCLPTVNSNPHPGIALQSLCSSSQPLCVSGDLGPWPGYMGLQQGLSGSHSIQTVTDQLLHSPTASNTSPVSQTIASI